MEIMMLKNFSDEFDTLDWKDKNKAREVLNQGIQMAAKNPTKEKLRPIVIELYKLLSDGTTPLTGHDPTVLTG